MGITDSPYLPKSRIKDYLTFLQRMVAYRIWRRHLCFSCGHKKNSSFKLLEVGCGPGYFLRCMTRWFPDAEINGLDTEKSLVDYSTKYAPKARLYHHDGHALPFPNSSFDVVCALQVIEHLEDPATFFVETARVLKEDGFLLLATPNPGGICAKLLGDKWHGIRYDHISLKSPDEWEEVFSKSGFTVIKSGTTGLTGFRLLRFFPFSLLNQLPMAIFGFFPWKRGESYMAILQRNQNI